MPRKRKTPVVQYPSPGSPYTITKFKRRFWTVKNGEELIAVVVYKKGAQEVVKHLEERDDLKRKLQGLRFIKDIVQPTNEHGRRALCLTSTA